MEQDDKKASMSEKDRKMAARFEHASDTEDAVEKSEDDDDDTETTTNKKTTKVPKRSLFVGSNEGPKETDAKTEKPDEKKNFLTELFTKDREIDTESVPAKESDNKEYEATESVVEKPYDISGETQLTEDFEEVVIDRLHEVRQELQETASEQDTVEAEASEEFLEQVGERIDDGVSPEQAIEQALAEALEDGGQDENAEEVVDVDPLGTIEDQDDTDPANPVTPPTPRRTPPPTSPVPPTPPSAPPPSQPPQPPVIPPTPNTSTYNPNVYTPFNPNIVQNTPNVAPTPNTVTSTESDSRRRRGDLLLGGVVGYMLGRRGGRKRTEDKLLPEIDKREKEIDSLKTKLEESEVAVRAEASKKVPEAEVVERVVVESSEPLVVEKPTIVERPIPAEPLTEVRAAVEQQNKAFEQQLDINEQKVVETEIVEVPVVTPNEKLTVKAPTEELSTKQKIESEIKQRNKEIEQARKEAEEVRRVAEQGRERIDMRRDPRSMTMTELLEVAEHIGYEKASLRQLYEHNRIDAVNLRRVVIEYFNGGTRYERLLRGSLEAVEMQRELRGEIKDESGFSSGGGSSDDGQQTPMVSAAAETSAQTSTTSNLSSSPSIVTNNRQPKQDHSMLNTSTAIVIGVVAGIIVVILLFAR